MLLDAYTIEAGTLFKRNAYWLSKQAVKYSTNVDTHYVAIFDWSVMFVFDFSGMKEDASDPKLARGIWFQESTSKSDKGKTFRSLLLGFLIRALSHHGIV